MKPWFWILIIAIVLIIWVVGSYNNFIVLSQNIDAQWSNVEVQYQRRIDLIPNLVNSVKGYMQFEKSLLEEITSLRSQWMNAGSVDDKIKFEGALDSALGRLLVVYENYPTPTSDTAVSNLMYELAGTENRISVERGRYNDMVVSYNKAVLMFPSNIIANIFGFEEKPYFKSQPGSETVPQVNITT